MSIIGLNSRISIALGIHPSLLSHSAFLLAATVLGQGLNFVVQILIARRIGAESYGLYNYAFAWISILAIIATLGNDQLLIRYASEFLAIGDRNRLYGVLRWSCCRAMAASGLLAAVFIVTTFVFVSSSTEHAWVTIWAAAALPAMVAAALTESLLRVYEGHAWATLPNRVIRPLLMVSYF